MSTAPPPNHHIKLEQLYHIKNLFIWLKHKMLKIFVQYALSSASLSKNKNKLSILDHSTIHESFFLLRMFLGKKTGHAQAP